MGGDKLLATIRKVNIPGTERITIAETTPWVQKWRAKNPMIVGYWAALEAAAMAAVRNPDMTVPCRAIIFQMRDGVLFARLPSGRELSYPAPVIKPGRFGTQQITFTNMEAGRRQGTQMYGGRWAENVTSAVARDLLVDAMKRLRAAGYKLVLHTHDEIVAEMPFGEGSVEEFRRLLVEVPAWAQGIRSRRRCSSATGSRRIEAVRNPCLDAAIAELRDAGVYDYEVAHGGRHPQIHWSHNGARRFYIVRGRRRIGDRRKMSGRASAGS